MSKQKKDYNPFFMVLPYLIGVGLVILTFLSFIFNYSESKLIAFIDKITWGDLYNLFRVFETDSGYLGMLHPLIMLNLLIYGFLIGWGIQSLYRKLRK